VDEFARNNVNSLYLASGYMLFRMHRNRQSNILSFLTNASHEKSNFILTVLLSENFDRCDHVVLTQTAFVCVKLNLRILIYACVFETPKRIRKLFTYLDSLWVKGWRTVNLYETHPLCTSNSRTCFQPRTKYWLEAVNKGCSLVGSVSP